MRKGILLLSLLMLFGIGGGNVLSAKNTVALEPELKTALANGGEIELTDNVTTTNVEDLNAYVAKIGDKTYSTLQSAIDNVQNNEIIVLLKDVTETVHINKSNVAFTIDGKISETQKAKYNGKIEINVGQNVTIKNIDFVYTSDKPHDFIANEGSPTGKNYNTTLLVENCTFTGNGKDNTVAVRTTHPTDIDINNCEGTKLHSFIQNQGGQDVYLYKITLTESKGGLSVGTTPKVTVRDCNLTTRTYGIRLDAELNAKVTLNGNKVSAYIPVCVRKATADNYELTFSGSQSSYTQTNKDDVWCAICKEEYEEGVALNDPTGNVKLTFNTDVLDESKIYGAYDYPITVVYSDGYKKGFDSLKSAMNFGYSGESTGTTKTIVVHKDITEEMNELQGNITTDNPDGVTIKNTIVNEWIYCSENFTIGENVTYDATGYASGLFVYAKDAVINGNVITDSYYQRYAGSKLTINEPGKMTVKTETFIVRYMDKDANAGIYIKGDNNDETIGLDAAVIYFYQGMINAKDANIKVGTYWQKNEEDKNEGSANLVLDNSKMVVTVNEHKMEANGNSSVTLTKGSNINVAGGYKGVGVSMDETSSMTKNGNQVFVAKIGDNYYSTLNDAVAACEAEQTVTLIDDVTVTEMIVMRDGKNVKIEGEGKTITFNTNTNFGFGVVSSTLTLGKGLNIVAKGHACPLYVQDGVAITSANIKTVNGNNCSPIMTNGGFSGTVTINGGEIIAEDSHISAIYWPSTGKLTVNNGSITGATAIYMKSGELEINDGKLTGNGEKKEYEYVSSGSNPTGDALVIENVAHGGYEAVGTVSINGGEFTSVNAAPIASYAATSVNAEAVAVTGFVSGGTFNKEFAAELCSDGYKLKANNDGTYGIVTNPIAKIGDNTYSSLQEAINNVKDGETVTLLRDVQLSESLVINVKGNITIDGQGYKIQQTESYKDTQNGLLMLGNSGYDDKEVASHNYTIKNVVFDGIKGWSVIRSQGVALTVDACTIQNSNQTETDGQSLIRLDYTEATIKNTTVKDNVGLMFITHNFNANTSEKLLTVDNCTLKDNTWNKTAAIYYVVGGGCNIKNSEFISNNVNCDKNGAVIYLGFQEDCSVESCLFKDNVVNDASTSTRVAGAIFFGYEANISNNVFVNNTASNANGDVLGQICTSTYYECNIDLGGNYWGGEAPVYGKDYTIQHTDPTNTDYKGTFELNDYYQAYTTDKDGNIVLNDNDKVKINYVAQIGKLSYTSLQAAFDAVKESETIVLLDEIKEEIKIGKVNKAVTINGNDKTATGLWHFGTDDNNPDSGKIIIDNVNFKDNGVVVVELAEVTIINCTFEDITSELAAIRVIGDKLTETVKLQNNKITNVSSNDASGIRVRNANNAQIENNVISNVNFTSILLEGTTNGDVIIKNNVLTNWAYINGNAANDGRAIRIAKGEGTCTIADNAMIVNYTAPEEFVKVSGTTANVSIDANYWNGANPTEENTPAYFDVADAKVSSYYKTYDAATNTLSDLVEISDYVAQIGEGENAQYFATLQAAFDAAEEGQTIVLIDDVELKETVTVASEKVVTLDLNGKIINTAWQDESAEKHYYAFTNEGTLTITDNSAEANGVINARGNYNYGTLTLEKGTINAIDHNGGYAVKNCAGKFTMNGGFIATTYENGDEPKSGNYDATTVGIEAGAEFVMNGGKINNISNFTLAIENYGTTTINENAGEVKSVHTTVGNLGTNSIMTINGGTFICDGNDRVSSHALWVNAGKTIVNGGTFDGKDNYNGFNVCASADAVVEINGGNFEPAYSGSLYGEGTITVKGGTFFDDVNARCAEGYAALPDLNGNFVVGTKPTATVNNYGATMILGGEYSIYDGSLTGTKESDPAMPLSFVMEFNADQDAEDMKTSPFADWYADFVITFTGIKDGSFDPKGCYLAGHYGNFGWVKIPVDGMLTSIENDTRYPVMLGVGMGQKYEYICSGVNQFKCALYLTNEVLKANPDIQVNLELAIVDNSQEQEAARVALVNNENVYKVVDFTYEAIDFNTEYAAKIGNTGYKTLEAAINAANDGDVVTLIRSTPGKGIVIDKSLTIDFNNCQYTFLEEGVGSGDVTSQGFQILQGNTVVLKNGGLNVAEGAKDNYYMLIQNYANLTVENMTLDATNTDKYSTTDGDSYAISNNSGTVKIIGNTTIKANNEGNLNYAFDSYKFSNYEAPVVTVNTTGRITGVVPVTSKLHIEKLGEGSDIKIAIEGEGQLFHNGLNTTIVKHIEGTENDGWYTISSPIGSVEHEVVGGLLNGTYDLYYFNEEEMMWENVKDKEDNAFRTLESGKGYLYANTADTDLTFKGELVTAAVNHPVKYTKGNSLAGFNLVGNPFTYNITKDNMKVYDALNSEAELSEGYYVLSNHGAWQAVNNGVIAPMQGVLIQTQAAGQLIISPKATETRSERADKGSLVISVANADYSDVAYVSFNEGIGLNKISHRNTEVPMVYVPVNGEDYAIAMMSEEVAEIPVSFKAMTMGEYTIGVEAEGCEFSTMTLVDRLSGTETNLLMEDYTFIARSNDNADRFVIKLNNNDKKLVDKENFVYICNGNLNINNVEGDGVVRIIDALGRNIAEYGVSGSACIPAASLSDGVYMIQLSDGDGVKVQKVVVE